MEPTQSYPLTYPVFEADQVLTNDDLNALFDYLDSQERLSRTRLTGMGIVCGLELTYGAANGTITVSAGCAVTSWGYLITEETVTLTHYRPYSVPDTVPTEDQYAPFTLGTGKAVLYELLSDAEFNNLNDQSGITALPAAPAGFLDDKVVVLYVEMSADNLKNCLTGDCDNKGIDMVVDVRRLLVGKDDLTAATGSGNTVTDTSGLPDLFLPRINVPATALNDFNGIYTAYTSLFDTAATGNIIDQLSTALQQAYQLISPLLPDFPASPFTAVKATLLKRLADLEKHVPYGIQYYYDFIDDLIHGYEELRHAIFWKQGVCCPDDNAFPLHIMLGPATQASLSTAAGHRPFRQYFIYSPLFNCRPEITAEIRLLFRRIKVMIDNFFVPSPAAAPNLNLRFILSSRGSSMKVKITPSRIGRAPLSERAIPYYYQIDNNNPIQVSWNYRKTSAGKSNQNLSYNAAKYNQLPAGKPFISPLLYSLEPWNFFRIEGHIGQHYVSVLQTITQQQHSYRLPFDVVAVKLGTDATDIQPDLTCSFSDLEACYDILKSALYCTLGDQICFYAAQPYRSLIPILSGGNLHLLTDLSNLSNASAETGSAGAGTAGAGTPEAGSTAAPASGTGFADFNAAALHSATMGLASSDVLKYAQLLPAALRAIFQKNVYAKGQFLSSRPCFTSIRKPPAGSTNVGLVYLSRVKQGAIPAYPPNDISLLSDYLLKMTDLIEEVVSNVFYAQLGYFDADAFSTAYQALTDYAASLAKLLQQPTITNATHVPAGLAAKLSAIGRCCDLQKFQALKEEYKLRLTRLQQGLLFANFIAKNPGIDHKAGVPKGGTFVLVYYEKPAPSIGPLSGTLTTGNAADLHGLMKDIAENTTEGVTEDVTKSAWGNTESSAPVKEETLPPHSMLKQLAALMQDKRYSFTAEQQQAILHLLEKKMPAATVVAGTPIGLPDKGVVADFYLPYRCCTECGSTTFVFPPEQPSPGDVTISMKPVDFCSGDTRQYPVTVQPAGGTVTGDGVSQAADGSFVFVPANLAAGAHTLTYTLQDKSATLKVTVTAALPQPNFSFKPKPTPAGAAVNFLPSGVDDNLQYHWDFGDGSGADVLRPDVHDYSFSGNEASYTVTFTVSSGPCSSSVSKPVKLVKAQQAPAFALQPQRFAFNDTGSYPFTIFPPVNPEDIVTGAGGSQSQLSNPDSLNLTVSGDTLSLQPAMPNLAATLITTLRYQGIALTVTIVRPVARFTITVKTTAGTPVLTTVAASTATIRFTALDGAVDSYEWKINGKLLTELVPGTAGGPSPEVNATALVHALGDTGQWEIQLTLGYTINGVAASDIKKAAVTTQQLAAAANKDPFEPTYA